MNLQITFFLTASGLFDFDLTFVAEVLLFLLLAFIVTFVFLSPVSKQLDQRAESINFSLRKASLYLTFEYNTLSTCLDLLTSETSELNRQLKLTKATTTESFEQEISFFQKENARLLTLLKGTLSIQSAFLLSAVHEELDFLTKNFFKKKFLSS
jgi:hypothetical protein